MHKVGSEEMMTNETGEITGEGRKQTRRMQRVGSEEMMTNETANRYTSKDNTYQYTCTALVPDADGATVGQCGRKYSVGEFIVTGRLSPEQLKARGGRPAGSCHCGAPFATEFECTKNVMWSLKIDGEETSFRPRRTLTRISGGSDENCLSPQFLALKQRFGTDPEFARAVRSTASETVGRTLNSTLGPIRMSTASRLSEAQCDALLSMPDSRSMVWFQAVRGRKQGILREREKRLSRRKSHAKAKSSHVREIFSHGAGRNAEAAA